MRIIICFILLISLAAFSCNSGGERTSGLKKPGKEEMADLNRYLVRKDRERIENYIARKNLQMTETQSGLWYFIRYEGEGEYLETNDRILIDYECKLLDGTPCYSSKETGPKEIIIGKSRIESGLDQGLRLLKPGGQAIFIIPPFLAWGFPGDGSRIPSRAVVVYDITILTDK